jgi:hypothetical protein
MDRVEKGIFPGARALPTLRQTFLFPTFTA